MNQQFVFVNRLKDILKEKKVTQKELARHIGEWESVVSDFINLKRGSLNIDLMLKIMGALEIEDLGEIFSTREVLFSQIYNQGQWVIVPATNHRMRFMYSIEKGHAYFSVLVVTQPGELIIRRFDITNETEDTIVERFYRDIYPFRLTYENPLSFVDAQDYTKVLIDLALYQGEEVSRIDHGSLEEAMLEANLHY